MLTYPLSSICWPTHYQAYVDLPTIRHMLTYPLLGICWHMLTYPLSGICWPTHYQAYLCLPVLGICLLTHYQEYVYLPAIRYVYLPTMRNVYLPTIRNMFTYLLSGMFSYPLLVICLLTHYQALFCAGSSVYVDTECICIHEQVTVFHDKDVTLFTWQGYDPVCLTKIWLFLSNSDEPLFAKHGYYAIWSRLICSQCYYWAVH